MFLFSDKNIVSSQSERVLYVAFNLCQLAASIYK